MKKKILLILFLFIQNCFSQTNSEYFAYVNTHFKNLKKLEFANLYLEEKTSTNKLLNILTTIIKDNGESLISDLDNEIKKFKITSSKSNLNNSLQNLINAYITLTYKKNRVNSFEYFRKAYKYAIKNKNKELIKYSLVSILYFYSKASLQNDKTYQVYLKKYKTLCDDEIDWLYYYNYKIRFYNQSQTYNINKVRSEKYLKLIISKLDSVTNNITKNSKPLVYYYIRKGNFIIWENPILAKKYYLKSWELTNNQKFYKPIRFIILNHLSRVSTKKNEHLKGLDYLKTASKYISINNRISNLFYINAYKAGHYYNLKIFDSAYIYENKARFSSYDLNNQKHSTEISKIREELNVKEKNLENLQLKKDNLEIESKRKQNRNLLFGSLLFIAFGGTIGYLTLKNSRKKHQLAEQQKELEKQKNLTLLKEQELITINAMVDGQEKERKHIAEDLHDNLGSVLATLKLHFENLRLNKEKKKFDQEALFDKTENLIDEAYLKVRKIAHAKNAGVIANQGLLVAIEMMAEKISAADSITIDVVHFGLNKQLKNSLEITIFRIVQELTTNIIKHANASQITINLSQYDNVLNIIVEDNGKGFDIEKVSLKNGMGLNSIQTRITHLKGTFEVDSTLNRGTSIIINIPLSLNEL